jgi:hypothetical protein
VRVKICSPIGVRTVRLGAVRVSENNNTTAMKMHGFSVKVHAFTILSSHAAPLASMAAWQLAVLRASATARALSVPPLDE